MNKKYPVTPAASLKPGQMSCFDVAGQRVILARVKDQFYAFEEMCSHEEFPLWYGTLKDHQVECSLHGARFDIRDGQPVFEPATKPITVFPVSVEQDTVYVELTD